MTALQQLIKIIKQKRKESEISNTLLKFVQFKAEILLKTEKKQQEDFAIGFAEWMAKEYWLNSSGKYTQGQTHKELLKIYKKNIMTPKKEAENLINEYRMILMNEDTDCGNEILCTSIAKKCALATVGKIEKMSNYSDFWNEVKKQIKKI